MLKIDHSKIKRLRNLLEELRYDKVLRGLMGLEMDGELSDMLDFCQFFEEKGMILPLDKSDSGGHFTL